MDTPKPIIVAALYQFARIGDPAELRPLIRALCARSGVKGTLILAEEGINGTIAGLQAGIDAVLAHLRALPGCADMDVKFSQADAPPFHRLKVHVKREIVTMGVPNVDPVAQAGTYVDPADWNALIADPETVVIDTRNHYEVRVGSFDGAIDPGTTSFRDFPSWFRENRDAIMASGKRRVAMFCTGGIRCEKATALVRAEGLDEVYHLKGGILKYLETVPPDESRWHGECFVFDQRVSVGHGLAPGTHDLCHGCRMPVSQKDRASALFIEGVCCPACHGTRDADKLARLAERHRQVQLAEARGQAHVGAHYPTTADDLDDLDG